MFWIAINLGFGIEGVAFITAFSYFLLSIINISLAEKEMKLRFSDIFKTFLSNLIYLIPLIPMLCIDLLYTDDYSIEHEFYKFVLFLIFFSPFLYLTFKNKEIQRIVFR